MPLPASGQISISQISVELGRASTAATSLGETASRTLAGVASGQISMSNFYGKSSGFSGTISTNQTNLNLRSWAVSNGWDATSPATITISSGVVISGNTPGDSTPALTINGSWPGGLTLINQGVIVGRGGNGGAGGSGSSNGVAGGIGGTALTASVSVSINNTGTIAGGGGGGGGGAGWQTVPDDNTPIYAGSGGGGGRSSNVNSSGGAGGVSFAGGVYNGNPGNDGTYSVSGSGGVKFNTASGGNGGNWGTNGSAGSNGDLSSGGAGGGAGRSINGNLNITWIATGTRLGPIF